MIAVVHNIFISNNIWYITYRMAGGQYKIRVIFDGPNSQYVISQSFMFDNFDLDSKHISDLLLCQVNKTNGDIILPPIGGGIKYIDPEEEPTWKNFHGYAITLGKDNKLLSNGKALELHDYYAKLDNGYFPIHNMYYRKFTVFIGKKLISPKDICFAFNN